MRFAIHVMLGAALSLTSVSVQSQSIPKPIPKPIPRPVPKVVPRAAPKLVAPRPIPRAAPKSAPRPSARAGNQDTATAEQNPWVFNPQDNQTYFATEAEAQTVGGYGTMFSLLLRCENQGQIIAQFGHSPGIGQAYINAYGEATINSYLNGIVNPTNSIQIYKGGKVVATQTEGQTLTPSILGAMASADRFVVSGGRQTIPFSGAGSGEAIYGLARACGILPTSGGATAGRAYTPPVSQPPPAPVYPALAADIPPEFVAGTIKLKKRGGCTRFYERGGRFGITEPFNREDWNAVARSVIDHGCSTDLAWFMLGRAAEGFGRKDTARIYFQQAIDVGAKFTLGNIYNTCGDNNEYPNPCLGVDVPSSAANGVRRVTGQ